MNYLFNRNQTDLFDQPVKPSFHNTVDMKGEALRKKEAGAKSLEAKILKLFESHPHTGYTRADLCLLFSNSHPEVSFGRALTNLSNDPSTGVYKSQEMRKGLYGVFNYVYKRHLNHAK